MTEISIPNALDLCADEIQRWWLAARAADSPTLRDCALGRWHLAVQRTRTQARLEVERLIQANRAA